MGAEAYLYKKLGELRITRYVGLPCDKSVTRNS